MSGAALRWLQDREALRQLMVDYFCGVDDRDFQRVADCFTPDVRATYDKSYQGRDALIEFIRGVRFFHTTLHCMGAQLFELAGDEAQMITGAMIAHHGRKGDGEAFEYHNSDARYVDHLTRQGEHWRVTQRGGPPAWPSVGAPAPDARDPALRWLIDRALVRDLLAQWTIGMDERDEVRTRACLAPSFDEAGRAGAVDSGTFASHAAALPRFESTHFLGVPAIDLCEDEAIVESSSLVTQRESGEPGKHPVLGFPLRDEHTRSARWRDRLVRRQGRWWISQRGPGTPSLRAHASDPPATGDPAIRKLLDRELIRDAVARSALARDRENGTTNHLVGNQEIELRGDEARVRSYVYLTRDEDGEDTPWWLGPLHWHDQLEQKGDGWRIAEHSEVVLLNDT